MNLQYKKLLTLSCVLLSPITSCFTKGGSSLRIGLYEHEESFPSVIAKATLHDTGMGKYYMICTIDTNYRHEDSISQWFIENSKKKGSILCKENSFKSDMPLLYYVILPPIKVGYHPLMVKRKTKAMNKQIKLFEKSMKDNPFIKSRDAFFRVLKFHKAPGGVSYTYLMWSKDKDSCYKKFAEIFGEKALVSFKKQPSTLF